MRRSFASQIKSPRRFPALPPSSFIPFCLLRACFPFPLFFANLFAAASRVPYRASQSRHTIFDHSGPAARGATLCAGRISDIIELSTLSFIAQNTNFMPLTFQTRADNSRSQCTCRIDNNNFCALVHSFVRSRASGRATIRYRTSKKTLPSVNTARRLPLFRAAIRQNACVMRNN